MMFPCAFVCLVLSLAVASASAGPKSVPPATTKTPPASSPYIPTDQDLQRYREHPYSPPPLTAEQRAESPPRSTQRPSAAPVGSSGLLTPEAVTYYCAGQAGIPLHGTVSPAQMALLSGCVEQHQHRVHPR